MSPDTNTTPEETKPEAPVAPENTETAEQKAQRENDEAVATKKAEQAEERAKKKAEKEAKKVEVAAAKAKKEADAAAKPPVTTKTPANTKDSVSVTMKSNCKHNGEDYLANKAYKLDKKTVSHFTSIGVL